jgi:hypothetical protein
LHRCLLMIVREVAHPVDSTLSEREAPPGPTLNSCAKAAPTPLFRDPHVRVWWAVRTKRSGPPCGTADS